MTYVYMLLATRKSVLNVKTVSGTLFLIKGRTHGPEAPANFKPEENSIERPSPPRLGRRGGGLRERPVSPGSRPQHGDHLPFLPAHLRRLLSPGPPETRSPYQTPAGDGPRCLYRSSEARSATLCHSTCFIF